MSYNELTCDKCGKKFVPRIGSTYYVCDGCGIKYCYSCGQGATCPSSRCSLNRAAMRKIRR